MPVDRDGTFRSELFERYQRSEKALVATLMQMYLEGVSTRKVRDVTETLCGTTFSRSTVSSLVSTLDADLAAWRERPLGEVAYSFVLVDATYQHVRVAGQVVSQAALIVMGVRDDGKREILAISVTGRESGPDYEDLFRGLRARAARRAAGGERRSRRPARRHPAYFFFFFFFSLSLSLSSTSLLGSLGSTAPL